MLNFPVNNNSPITTKSCGVITQTTSPLLIGSIVQFVFQHFQLDEVQKLYEVQFLSRFENGEFAFLPTET